MKGFYICAIMTLVSVSLSHPPFNDGRDKTVLSETDIEDGRVRVPFDSGMKKTQISMYVWWTNLSYPIKLMYRACKVIRLKQLSTIVYLYKYTCSDIIIVIF